MSIDVKRANSLIKELYREYLLEEGGTWKTPSNQEIVDLLTRNGYTRKEAEKLGLPKSIAYRKKKAIQYSTGVAQLLRHLAKKKGLSLRDYITKIFNELNFERGIP